MGIRTADGIVSVTPALDAGNAYADADVMAVTTEIPGAVAHGEGSAVLLSLTVIDRGENAGAFHVVFMRSDMALGTINDAPSFADGQADEIIGYVSVAAADYINLQNSQVATVEGLGLELQPSDGTSLYFGVISDGNTNTYAADDLVFKFGFLRG